MNRLTYPILAALLFVVGCSTLTPQDVAVIQADQAALTAELPKVDAEIAKLPADSDLRKFLEKHRKEIVDSLKISNGLLDSASQGHVTEDLKASVSQIPYASLVLTVAGIAYGFYERRQKAKLHEATTQIVQSVEAAFPNKTADEKMAMASVQDAATRKLVSGMKSDSPTAGVVLNEPPFVNFTEVPQMVEKRA
jgi:hypothetical protein